MLNHQPPRNWIADRVDCNIDLIFEALCQVVERDVSEMNKLSSDTRNRYIFSTGSNGDGVYPMLRVYRSLEDFPDKRYDIATFEQRQAYICIVAPGISLKARPWVDKEGCCLLDIDGTQYRIWELSQKILGPLFFDDDYPRIHV